MIYQNARDLLEFLLYLVYPEERGGLAQAVDNQGDVEVRQIYSQVRRERVRASERQRVT